MRLAVPLALVATILACHAPQEGLDASKLPPSVRADYAVFALRCSKCHSLQRPLSAQLYDDEAWTNYVTRMRRQPASAISEGEAVAILRFLHYYTLQQNKPADAGRSGEAEGGP